MSVKIKAGTCFLLPVTIDDSKFDYISAIEFLFKQTDSGKTLKTAYWSKNGESRDAYQIGQSNTINVKFTRADSYLFRENDMFFMDTRIHYIDAETNPPTNIVRLRMRDTLFDNGEEVIG